MGDIQADAIVSNVAKDLLDSSYTFWTKSTLLRYLNDAQRVIVQVRPDANSQRGSHQLVAGSLQTIPNGHERFLAATRNMGVDGATPGRVITLVEREYLDQSEPDWFTATPSAVVKHVVFDERDPTHFFVYPPQPAIAPHQAELLTSKPPIDCTIDGVDGAAVTTKISVSDIYQPSIEDYMKFRALMMETNARNPQKAMAYYQAFAMPLGLKVQSDRRYDADKHAEPQTVRGTRP